VAEKELKVAEAAKEAERVKIEKERIDKEMVAKLR
jgi:hypothetical protein